MQNSYNTIRHRFNSTNLPLPIKAQCNQPALGSSDDFIEVYRGVEDGIYVTSLATGEPVLANTEYTFFIQAHRKDLDGEFQSGPQVPMKRATTGDAVVPNAPETPTQNPSTASVIIYMPHPAYLGGAPLESCILQFGKMEGVDSPEMVWTTLYEGLNTTVDLESSSYIKAGRTYRVRSACKNIVIGAFGPYSQVGVASAAKIQGKPPKAPASPTFGVRAGNSIEVKWTPPKDTGNIELVGYVLNYTIKNSEMVPISHRIMGEETSSTVISNLDEYTDYEFRVAALNAAYFCVGDGAFSTGGDAATIRPSNQRQ